MLGYAFVVDPAALDERAFFAGLVAEAVRRAADSLLKHRSDATTAEIAYRLVYPKDARPATSAVLAALSAATAEDGPSASAGAAGDPFSDWSFSVEAACPQTPDEEETSVPSVSKPMMKVRKHPNFIT